MLKAFSILIAAGISQMAWSNEIEPQAANVDSGTANVEALDARGLSQEYSALMALTSGTDESGTVQLMHGDGGGGNGGGRGGGGDGCGGGNGGRGGNGGGRGGGSDNYGRNPFPYNPAPSYPTYNYHVCFARNHRGVVYRAQGYASLSSIQQSAVNGCVRNSRTSCAAIGCRQ